MSRDKKKEKETRERNKIYHKSPRRKTPIYASIAVCIIYAFFFLSNIIMPTPITEADGVTKIGEETDFAEKRTYVLLSCQYSEKQELMEIVIQFTNNNYDRINEYYYALMLSNAKTSKVELEEKYNEDLFTVLHIKNLPKGYGDMELLFAPKTTTEDAVTDDITGTAILNRHNVESVGYIDPGKTKSAYLKDRLDGMIASLEERLGRQQKKLDKLRTTKQALMDEAQSYEENKKYMTADEIARMDETVKLNQEDAAKLGSEIENQKQKISKTQEKITEARQKRDAL